MAVITKKVEKKGDFTIRLGSGSECDIPFSGLEKEISPFHSELKRNGDRLFLRDLNSKRGTYVNDRRIGNNWHEITLVDNVRLGSISVEIKPKLLLGRDRIGIEAYGLYYSIYDRSKRFIFPPKKLLTENVTVFAEPKKILGIMGPSGAGKTVLMDLMSGFVKPEKGMVMVGDFDVHQSFGLLKDVIGHVPQDDTLIAELTVKESLHYCLRLRYPDMHEDIRERNIQMVLKKMGFSEEKLDKLLKTRIGSPQKRGLSGGERKRVNIAHELIRNPLILFLDEPTSGLSSVDSEHVVRLLKTIAEEQEVTMLMTIHQPSGLIYDMIDNLLLVSDGKIAYFGAGNKVTQYFQNYSDEDPSGNPAEYVLRVLYNKKAWKADISPEKLYQIKQDSTTQLKPQEGEAKKEFRTPRISTQKKITQLFYQFSILFERNLLVKYADKLSLALLLGQALIISLLLLITFQGYATDYPGFDELARTWYRFVDIFDTEVSKGNIVFLESTLEQSQEWARLKEHHYLISENSAQRRASVLFLMIAASIWFGIVNASREIVAEKSILKRETRGSLQIPAYLLSKVTILVLISFIQTGILLGFITTFLMPVGILKFFQFWFILLMTSFAATCLGLFISSMVSTQQASLIAVPIIIIPQLFLGGLVRPFRFLTEQPVIQGISDFILQKWSFKSILAADSAGFANILFQNVDYSSQNPFKTVQFQLKNILDVYFGKMQPILRQSFIPDIHSFLMICLHAGLPLILTYFILKRKYY